MAMAVVDQTNDSDLVSNMIASNQERSMSSLTHELVNPDPLGIVNEEYISPICPRSNPVEGEEMKSVNKDPLTRPLSGERSPLHGHNTEKNNSTQVHDDHAQRPKPLIKPYEERNNSPLACNINSEYVNNPDRNHKRLSWQEKPGSPINIQLIRSPEGGSVRQHAWGDSTQRYLQNEGYNSDSDVLKNRSRNKKNSWDESPYGSYEKKPEFSHFIKTHRRVKSGDTVGGFDVNDNNSTFQPFHTPPYVRPRFMQHSQSQGNISVPPQEQRLPVLSHQSVSVVDTSVANREVIHQHLCLQSTTFVSLQAAIADATKEVERLERDRDAKLLELDAGLNVKQNPTHKDCTLLQEEVDTLTKEIQDMFNECDSLGIQVDGDPPTLNSSERAITKQPSQTQKLYQNVEIFDPPNSPSVGGCPMINKSPPPPIPPRLPVKVGKPISEHWICPQCTFKNLLVSDCEICLSPRPTSLR